MNMIEKLELITDILLPVIIILFMILLIYAVIKLIDKMMR